MAAAPTDNVTMSQASAAYQHFYVPQFELKIADASTDPQVLRDIVEVTYKDKLDEIDSCEITVNNWDASLRAFKYIGSEKLDDQGKPLTNTPASKYWTYFDPCNKTVKLSMGYSGVLEEMIVGQFVTLEPSFPSSGAPTLQVRLLNQIHQLRRKKYDGSWGFPITDSEIAKKIGEARDPKMNNEKRFPIPIRPKPKNEPQLTFVQQKNQYDIDFLWKRARVNGYVVQIRIDDKTGETYLHFGPSNDDSIPITYKLEWGQSLVELKATITTANQYRSVTVRGWDRATQKAIEEKVDLDDPEVKKINPDLSHLTKQCDPREDYVEEAVVTSKDEARKFGAKRLLDATKGMVKITGSTIGLPKLRAGSRIVLGDSIGSRLSGIYFVTSTTHTINNSGYTTRFEARREGMNSGAMP